jgi:RNA polymerase sigma factor (sigma-70 family)
LHDLDEPYVDGWQRVSSPVSVLPMWSGGPASAPSDFPEARLIALGQRGDRDALGQLYRQHSAVAYTLALRICSRRDLAHDIVHDSFLRAFERLGSFRGEAAFSAWLKRIVANVAVEALRGGKARWSDEAELDAMTSSGPDLAARHDALGLLARLAASARTVLVLYEMEGYSHREIATLLGRTETWSKTILSRARARLADFLDEQGVT